jgi:hypothetical protein
LNPVRCKKEKEERVGHRSTTLRGMVAILEAYHRKVVKLNLLRFQVFVVKKVFQILLP